MKTLFKPMMLLLIFLCSSNVFAEQPLTLENIKKQAEQGDARAQAQLGSIYFLGSEYQPKSNARFKTRQAYKEVAYLLEGVGSNTKIAAEWLMKAADQNYADAEVFLAALHDRGMGVKQNPSEATRLYKKASQHGNETATAIIGQYANTRLIASKDIPETYALKILNTK